jgi:hypothetical protein
VEGRGFALTTVAAEVETAGFVVCQGQERCSKRSRHHEQKTAIAATVGGDLRSPALQRACLAVAFGIAVQILKNQAFLPDLAERCIRQDVGSLIPAHPVHAPSPLLGMAHIEIALQGLAGGTVHHQP